MLRIISVILLISIHFASSSHAVKHRSGRGRLAQNHAKDTRVEHQIKAHEIEKAIRFQRKNAQKNHVLFQCSPQILTISRPSHYVIAGLTLYSTLIVLNEFASSAQNEDIVLPYEFQIGSAKITPLQAQAPFRTLPAPFVVQAMAPINDSSLSPEPACFASLVAQKNHHFLTVVRPGQIDCGPHYQSIAETSAAFYEKTRNAHDCKVGTTTIHCDRSANDKHEPIATLDGDIAFRYPFEKPMFGEAWRFLEETFMSLSTPPHGSVQAFFEKENFPLYLATLNSIVLVGMREPSTFRGLSEGADFFATTPRYIFKNIHEWPHLIAEHDPELQRAFYEIVDVAKNLDYYLSDSPRFLKNYYHALSEEKGELSFARRMSYAFNFFVYSGRFETNRFLNENFFYAQAYSDQEYAELLEDLRQTTLQLYDGDPIKAAAYFLPRFTQIRPFIEGNGRTARLVLNLILMSKNITPPLFLSNNQYREMCRKSWSKTQYLPLDMLLQKDETNETSPPPFETFLRQTLCVQASDMGYFSDLIEKFEQCEKGCQRMLDELIDAAAQRDVL